MGTVVAFQSALGRGRGGRLLLLFTRLPVPVFALICGREWFAEASGGRA